MVIPPSVCCPSLLGRSGFSRVSSPPLYWLVFFRSIFSITSNSKGEIMAKILIVDDESDVREMLRDMLEFLEYDVEAVPGGAEALEMIDGTFDLVITDMNMPEIGGKKLLTAIKLRAPELPVAVITGYGASETKAEVEAMGASGFLKKPFHIPEMENLVEEVLSPS